MAITNFIPTVWSENLYKSLDRQYIGVANCSREFEGDIKNMGDRVKICGVGSVALGNYTKNSDMSTPQTLNDTSRELVIDKAKYFNFQIDDIDRAQSSPKLMDAAMRLAADALANDADAYIYTLCENAAHTITVDDVNVDNIIDTIIEAREKLYESNVHDASSIVIEVSPKVASLILKAKVALSSNNADTLETGCLGSIGGCKIFVSNNIVRDESDTSDYHKCLVRTKRAIAYAEQLSEVTAYCPEKRFADAVKGLHLYGAKVIYPQEMVLLDLCFKSHYDENGEEI